MGNLFNYDYIRYEDLYGDWYVIAIDENLINDNIKYTFSYKSDDEYDITIIFNDKEIKGYGKIKPIYGSGQPPESYETKALNVELYDTDHVKELEKIGQHPNYYGFIKINNKVIEMTVNGRYCYQKEIILSRSSYIDRTELDKIL